MAKGSYIGQVQIGNNTYPVGSILYGTASYDTTNNYWLVNNYNLTTTTFTNDNLTTGVTIHIKFDAINSANTPKLKVGAAAEKTIVKYGTAVVGKTAATSWVANSIVSFTYDGTSWVMNTGIDSNTEYTASSADPVNISSAASAGSSAEYSRGDHKHKIVVTQGSNSGEIIIGGTTVKPKNLAAAAYKSVSTSIPASGTTDDAKLPTVAAVKELVTTATSGLTGAMHFLGITSTDISTGDPNTTATISINNSNVTAINGDVILYGNQEYVWGNSKWNLLGDEGSYALKSNTIEIGSASGWNAGSPPILGNNFSIPNVISAGTAPSLTTESITFNAVNSAGSITTAEVTSGTLHIYHGSSTTITSKTISGVTSWNAGSATELGSAFSVPNITSVGEAPSLTITSTTVVKP